VTGHVRPAYFFLNGLKGGSATIDRGVYGWWRRFFLSGLKGGYPPINITISPGDTIMSKINEAHCQNWCITLYNNDASSEVIPLINELPEFLEYLEYGVECCPSTGRPHLQCNARLKVRGRVTTIVNKFKKLGYKCGGKGVDSMKGSWDEATAYVKKGMGYIGDWATDKTKHISYGDNLEYYEFGTRPINKSGSRTDLKNILLKAKAGLNVEDMIMKEEVTSYQQYKFASDMCSKYAPKRHKDIPIRVEVYHGGPNTGKSYIARKKYPGAFITNLNGDKWLEGYEGEEVIIFDDFRGCYIKFLDLLRIIDVYGDYKAKVNYKAIHILAHTFVFTSALHPRDWYPNMAESYEQLDGRITYIKHMDVVRTDSHRHKIRAIDHLCDDEPSKKKIPFTDFEDQTVKSTFVRRSDDF